METKDKLSITLRIDQSVVSAIDVMREPMRLTRTQWLRKAIQRNLDRNRQELPLIMNPKIQAVLRP